MNNETQKTRWHRLLGKMLEELLSSVDITVTTEIEIMSQPPKADLLLLRKHTPRWTKEQLALLPDGIRDSEANHILIEFKYTESVNRGVLAQATAYDTLYRRVSRLPQKSIQTFIISAKTPVGVFLKQYGYTETEKPGVLASTNPMLNTLPIISLNNLDDQPHNRFIKCFASRKKVKQNAFETIFQSQFSLLEISLQYFFSGLWKNWFGNTKGDIMEKELTPEKVIEIGKLWGDAFLNSLPPGKRLAGIKPQERLTGLTPEEMLAALKAQALAGKLSGEDIENFLNELKNK